MMAAVRRLRLPQVASWVLGFLVGQWLVAQTHLDRVLGSILVVWRVVVLVAIYILLMLLIDKIWRSPSAEGTRTLAREFVDAAIVGLFVGFAVAV